MPAMRRAARPALNTASCRETWAGRTARASAVAMRNSGMKRTTDSSDGTGTGAAYSRSSSVTTSWSPPRRAAATLSGCPFYSSGHFQQFIIAEHAVAEGVGGNQAPGNGGGAAAQAAAEGNPVVAAEAQGRHLAAGLAEQEGHRPGHQVVAVLGQLAGAFADDFHHRAACGSLVKFGQDLQLVPEVKGQAQAVVTRAQVGGSGGSKDPQRRRHLRPEPGRRLV